ncbi:MAG: vWA domain-containing protein [Pseudomonadota bacterium]
MISIRAVLALLVATFLGLVAFTRQPSDARETELIEVVVVLDTTASMAPTLARLKLAAPRWASDLQNAYPDARLRFGLVAYRDQGDAYLTRRCPLGLPEHFLSCLQQQTAAGGGGGEEALLKGLEAAAASSWSREADRQQVVLIGDAPGHRAGEQAIVRLIDAEQRQGRTFDTLQVGHNPRAETQWREIARRGGGAYNATNTAADPLRATLSGVWGTISPLKI